jgi:hypothetical protein
MPQALRIPGYPATQVIGSEFQGKGVPAVGQDNAGNITTPNGTIGSSASITAKQATAIAATGKLTGLK